MIKSVELHNFLSHRHSVIHLHELNNIFVGASDSGKSAFIKGIKWCRWNRPLGDDFYSWPEVRDDKDKDMWVKVITDDHVITRKKGKQEEYILDGVSFKAFGTNVPEEIVKAFNIEEVNWQNQLDSHFLLNLSAGDAATYFNKVAKLDAIDRGTNSINSAIREITSDIKYKSEQETKLINDIATYPDMYIYECDVESLESLEKEKAVLANSVNKLHAVASAYRLADANLKEKSEILVYEKPILDLMELYKERNLLVEERKRLYFVFTNIASIQDRIKVQGQQIALEVPLVALLKLHEDKKMIEATFLVFSTALSNIKSIQERIVKGNAYIKTQEEIFKTEMGSQCILCGSQLKHEH